MMKLQHIRNISLKLLQAACLKMIIQRAYGLEKMFFWM